MPAAGTGSRSTSRSGLHSDLGLKLAVELVSEDALIEYSNRGREGKPKRIIDRRYEKK